MEETQVDQLPSCGVVLSTYNSPAWLERVLWGYEQQSCDNFEIFIADDGSSQETADLIQRFRDRGTLRIHHVWHEDIGFRKTEILNRAVAACTADYMIFSDGDCIPSPTFVADHLKAARPGHFVAATLFRMSDATSKAITHDDISSQKIFSPRWLRANQQPWSYKLIRLGFPMWLRRILNKVTPTTRYWAGCNASAWRSDIVAANGFDERMKYGGEDKEFGERLMNNGIRPISLRYTIICMHLDHSRGYVNQQAIDTNLLIRQAVRRDRRLRTDYGIESAGRSEPNPKLTKAA